MKAALILPGQKDIFYTTFIRMKHTLLFFILFAGFIACNPSADKPTDPAPPAVAQTEAGEPLAASNAAVIVAPTVYVSYSLTRGAGAIQTTGGEFVQTKAWQAPAAGQVVDPTILMRDLISALEKEGVLAGVDLTKPKANWLRILYPGASPRRDFVLDSRDLPQPKKE